MIPAQLYADLAEVCLRDAQAIAAAEEPEMSLEEIRTRAMQLYGPGKTLGLRLLEEADRCAP